MNLGSGTLYQQLDGQLVELGEVTDVKVTAPPAQNLQEYQKAFITALGVSARVTSTEPVALKKLAKLAKKNRFRELQRRAFLKE